MATMSREASKQNATASPNTGFAAHFVHPNALHFAKPNTVMGKFNKTTTTQRTDKRTTDFFLIIIILFEKLIIFAK